MKMQRRIQNLVEQLRWSLLRKYGYKPSTVFAKISAWKVWLDSVYIKATHEKDLEKSLNKDLKGKNFISKNNKKQPVKDLFGINCSF